MDREVSELKFDQAVTVIRGFALAMPKDVRPWELVRTTFPILEVVHVHPRTQRRVGFRYECEDWPEVAPSLSLFDPQDGRTLTYDEWPKGVWAIHPVHPSAPKPFLCLPGIREYHTHGSHLGDHWDNYRSRHGYSLGNILHRVWQKFEETNG